MQGDSRRSGLYAGPPGDVSYTCAVLLKRIVEHIEGSQLGSPSASLFPRGRRRGFRSSFAG